MTTSSSMVDTRLPLQGLLEPGRAHHVAMLTAAGLVGFAGILWLAANWDGFAKMTRFWLVGGALMASGLAALLRSSLLAPGLLVAFAATGGLLALIGQTYQTGADAWQLFALWAALGLPLAFAARSDALWTPLVAVAMTAVVLWQGTTLSGAILSSGAAQAGSALPPTLASWALGMAIAGTMSLDGPGMRWLGSTRWAFRLSALALLANVATCGVSAMLSPRGVMIDIVMAAAVILAGIAAWLYRRAPRDALLLSATALAIDVVIISGLIRLVITDSVMSTAPWERFLFVGALSAAVVAASVIVVIRMIRTDASTGQGASMDAGVINSVTGERPWPTIVLSAIGALLAFIPLVLALGMLLGDFLMEKGPGAYIFGALVAAGCGFALKEARQIFVEQMAAIGFATGAGLVIYALYRDLPDGPASLIVAVSLIVLAIVFAKPWLAGLLAAAATGLVAIGILQTWRIGANPNSIGFLVMWSALALSWVGLNWWQIANRTWLEPLPASSLVDPMTVGMATAVLLALSVFAGQTFLADGLFGIRATRVHTLSTAGPVLSDPRKWIGIAMMLGAIGLMQHRQQILNGLLGIVAAITALALAVFMPRLGPVAVIFAVALLSGRRNLAILSVIAALWIVGNFYYALDLPLSRKALILGACGATLGLGAWASRPKQGSATPTGWSLPAISGASRAVAALGLLAAAGVSAYAISGNEALIRDGKPVFVDLAPVDPRSLMQGDYMALRFRIPDSALRHHARFGARPHAVGQIDANGLAKLDRIAASSDPIAANEIRIELTPVDRGAWTVVTNAWFFKEGTAKTWEGARFGEFRVLPNGRALLVGLADKDMRRID